MSKPDLSEFVALSKPKQSPCSVAAVLASLDAAESQQLEAALSQDARLIKHSAISAWLAQRNYKVSGDTVSRHRRRECACDV